MEKLITYPLCANVTTVCQPPVYNELLKEECTSLSGSSCYRRVSDVYLLLNQNRIDRQCKEALIEQINDAVGSSGLAELRNKYSDEELCSYVKSRYIQSKSELHDYMKYLMFAEKKQIVDKQFEEKLKQELNPDKKLDKKESENETKTE